MRLAITRAAGSHERVGTARGEWPHTTTTTAATAAAAVAATAVGRSVNRQLYTLSLVP